LAPVGIVADGLKIYVCIKHMSLW